MRREASNEERLYAIEEIVTRMELRLFGNGQPGELATIKSRLSRLESWFWRACGAIGIVMAAIEVFGHLR